MKQKKYVVLIVSFMMIFTLCGFLFGGSFTETVNTDKNRVYQYVSAETISSDFVDDTDAAKKKYAKNYYLLSGEIGTISKKGDSISLIGNPSADNRILCSCPKEKRAEALLFKPGDRIGIFGKVKVDLIDKDVHIEAEKIVIEPAGIKTDSYFLKDGTKIEKGKMLKRSLNEGNVSYLIPSGWSTVECDIREEGIGEIEGYQYALNKLPGTEDGTPESFFICYFNSKKQLASVDDAGETKLIEQAIIDNISGEENRDKIKHKRVSTYYGAEYDYYQTIYTDKFNSLGNGYHVEYIFQEDGKDGLVMYLYVYKDAKHLSDVMFVTNFLEINSNP